MNTLKKLCVLTALLLFSCNAPDEPVDKLNSGSDREHYSTNPYKDIGSLYHKMARLYHLRGNIKIDLINGNLHYILLSKDIKIIKANSVEINAKNTGEDTSLYDLIENSPLSQLGKTSLHGFTDDLQNYNGEEIYVVLQAIDSYQAGIINNTTLTSYDKQVILTFISLVETDVENQSLYPLDNLDDHIDEDWNIIIGNLIDYLNIALSQSPEQMTKEIFKSLKGL